MPNPLDLGRLVDVKKVYICIRNSLELAVEEGAKTIVRNCLGLNKILTISSGFFFAYFVYVLFSLIF